MKKESLLLLLFISLLFSFNLYAQLTPLPRNLQFDSLTLVLTWDAPQAVLLDEHFEAATFPPSAWKDSTQGMGWFSTTNGSSAHLLIPQHSKYVVINNGLAAPGNNGCCDYLITPEMDLTQAYGFNLSFSSFFKGADAETASVLISTDGGSIWTPLFEVLPHFAWANLQVDLSPYSGITGYQHVKIAFMANDHGQSNATGWAIDDVVVASDSLPIQEYNLFLDGAMVGSSIPANHTWTYDPSTISYASAHNFCLSAFYPTGMGNIACKNASGYYLAPPVNLMVQKEVSTNNSGIAILTWQSPVSGDKKTDASYARFTASSPVMETADVPSGFVAKPQTAPSIKAFDVLFDNGTIVNSPGTGAGGADESVIPAGGSAYGYNYNQTTGGTVADDFIVPVDWTIKTLRFDGYQTLSGNISTIIGLYFRIYNGDPSAGGTVVWGDLTTNRMTSSYFSGVYRVSTPGQNVSRPVMNIVCENLSISLAPGTYWLEWQAIGTLASGPWTVNTAYPVNANARQFDGLGWNILVNPDNVDLPFVIEGSLGSSSGLISYNIYRDNELLTNVPPAQHSYADLNLNPGTYCYDVSAVYDLTSRGFPGQMGESLKEGPACANFDTYLMLPFLEDWTTGQFDVNLWGHGANWVIDASTGSPEPATKFSSTGSAGYNSSLLSYYMYSDASNTITPNCVFLDFDYLLSDNSASGSEKLSINILINGTIIKLKELANTGTTVWIHEHINISSLVKGKIFRAEFVANGPNGSMINYWLVDNIHVFVKYGFAPPLNLIAENAGNPLQNDIQLHWDIPHFENYVSLIQDDSTWENKLNINAGYTAWLGNKFTSLAGKLHSASVYWIENTGSTHSPVILDVYDAAHSLLGSSDAFIPVTGSWQNIALPGMETEGDFYVMVRFDSQSGETDFLGMDSTTLSGRPNNGWYTDGSSWSQMNTMGFDEAVFSIRATLATPGNCEQSDSRVSTVGIQSYSTEDGSTVVQPKMKSAGSITAPAYDVYRREYQIPLPGQDSLFTAWHKIASVSANNCLDQNLEKKCYQYYVQAMYDEGSSEPGNTSETCFLTGIASPITAGIKVYPNPAEDFLTIEMNTLIECIVVYNATGSRIMEAEVKGSSMQLNVAGFAPGIYNLRFVTHKGDCFNSKFVKL